MDTFIVSAVSPVKPVSAVPKTRRHSQFDTATFSQAAYVRLKENDDGMNYFTVTFLYPGPFSDTPGDIDALGNEVMGDHDKACWQANVAAETILRRAGLEMRHGYSWPDGTLYKYVRTTLCLSELSEKLRSFSINGTYVSSVRTESSDYNPGKSWCESLKDYFCEKYISETIAA